MTNKLHFGVSVGIDRYPEFPDLSFARRDAEAFADWMMKDGGGAIPEKNVEVVMAADTDMADDTPRRRAVPVRTTVYEAIQAFWEVVRLHVEDNPEDWAKTRLYVYVSGHGIGPSTKDSALLLANAGPRNFGENISCFELITHLGEAQYFAEVVIFADCCRDRVTNAPLGKPPWTLEERDFGEVNTALGVAADYGGKAYEPDADEVDDPDEYRGHFTRALLEGLNGQGANGEITTHTLAGYVDERVKELLKPRRKFQKCHIYADSTNPIKFGTKAAPGLRFKIVFESDYHGEAVLLDGDTNELKRKQIDGSGSQWPLSLNKGLYRVVAPDGSGANFRRDGYFSVVGGEDVIL